MMKQTRNLSLEFYLGEQTYVICDICELVIFTKNDNGDIEDRIKLDSHMFTLLNKYISELDNTRN